MSDIDELAALAKAATPGPYRTRGEDDDDGGYPTCEVLAADDVVAYTQCSDIEYLQAARNAEYIAACSPDAILDLIRRVWEAEARNVTLKSIHDEAWTALQAAGIHPSDIRTFGEFIAEIATERDEARADLATMTRVYERACDSQVEAQRERDEARADRDSAHRMMEEAARRLDVDTDGLKPVHVFRAIDALRAERDAAMEARPAITPEDAREYMDGRHRSCGAPAVRVHDALREHARKAWT